MTVETRMGTITEPQREVPVAYDVDVAVVGAGIAGLFAALAAGRQGANTLLIDRFGSLGGNIGPAMIVAGGLYGQSEGTLVGDLTGLPRELIDRLAAIRATQDPNYPEQTNLVSYLGVKMAEEAGVELLLSVWAADPIIEGDRVTGLFVEGKSGRVGVRAKVVVDATADVDIARRAGVPVITELPYDPSFAPLVRIRRPGVEYPVWNDTALFYLFANVDLPAYEAFTKQRVPLSEEDKVWLKDRNAGGFPQPLLPMLRQAWENETYRHIVHLEPHLWMESVATFKKFGSGLLGARLNVRGELRREDMKQNSRVEAAVRVHVVDTVEFFREHVPGFENAYLLFMAPYFGARGGPCIEGEHTVTPQEAYTGQKFDDVMFRNIHEGLPEHGGDPSGFDAPYRMLLPKGMDGLLVTGRGAAYLRRGHDPTGMRSRPSIMALGEATGIAAALAARPGATPKTLDVQLLQREMLKQDYFLGDADRLTALGLS